jgi:hypothetical protein
MGLIGVNKKFPPEKLSPNETELSDQIMNKLDGAI